MALTPEAVKASVDIVSVVGKYTRLKKVGSEFFGPCPIHHGDGDNFNVVPAKGIWVCWSHGCHECDEGNDVIGFIRRVENLGYKEACEYLTGQKWEPVALEKRQPKPRPTRKALIPPADAPEPNMRMPIGIPTRHWLYRTAEGGPLMYVARYETPQGKEIRCFCWAAGDGEEPAWHCQHYTRGERPLYQLDRIAAYPNAQIVVVEGEKAADAAQALLPQLVVSTWPGGAQAWKLADWKPLQGRNVVLWPDADEPGRGAMNSLAAILADPRGLACKVKIIDTADLAEGFDAADWQGENILEWLRSRAKEYAPAQPPSAPEPEADNPPPAEFPPEYTKEPPKKPKQRPRLRVIGNTAAEPEEDVEAVPFEMSEDALATHFANVHADKWRYVKAWGQWFQWRGDGWYKDETALIDRLAVEITRQAIYWPEAATLSADAKRRVNSRRTAGAVRDLAMTDQRIAARVDQWDTSPWLLGVPGGVVDLKTGEFKDARPEDYMTKRTLVAPQQGRAPIWESFLNTVMDGNAGMIEFLQMFAGYCLTGETREQCLAFLYGTGQNGKGVFITTLANILGDYALSADADVFMESDHQRHPTEMARLRGARLVTVDETDGSKRWNEKRIKRITGGGRIEARFMRQDDFEFLPQFKLLIAGNHKPQLRGVGKAIQRRIHLVPFTVTIRDEDRDDELPRKLEAEYPQILQWMIDGCRKWQEHGLRPPAEVVNATRNYIEAEDTIGEWLEERTEQTGSTARPVAYKNYRAWMDGRGERAWSSKAFWGALEERGYICRKSNGQMIIDGLGLRSSGADEPLPPHYDY